MTKIFITFGFGQYGGELANAYIILDGESHMEARAELHKKIKGIFCTSCDIEELHKQIAEFPQMWEVSEEEVIRLYAKYYPKELKSKYWELAETIYYNFDSYFNANLNESIRMSTTVKIVNIIEKHMKENEDE